MQSNQNFPFEWADTNFFRNSVAYRKEIYLKEQNNLIENLVFLFHSLFGCVKNKLLIYNEAWWNFCLDTWNINTDEYNYDLEGKSVETQKYLRMLKQSQLQLDYSGCCVCKEWDFFLYIVLECIINQKAPYSPLFCDMENKFFFYFHETGSIGLYYKEENDVIQQILTKAYENYVVKD
jgi:hypothetical protein